MIISIIIPVFNTEINMLDQCILSIVAQKCTNVEIVIIDDGSRLEVAHACDRWASIYEYIRVYHRKNCGVSAARNFGISVATGDVITFVDSDDWCDNQFLQFISENMLNNDILIFDACIVRNNNKYFNKFFEGRKKFEEKEKGLLVSQCICFQSVKQAPKYHGVGCVCCKVYRKNLFSGKDGLRFPVGQRVSEDAAFNCLAFNKAKHIEYIPEILYYWREDNHSASRSYDYKYIETCTAYIDTFRKIIVECGYENEDEVVYSYNYRRLVAIASIFDLFVADSRTKNKLAAIRELSKQKWVQEYNCKLRNLPMHMKVIEFLTMHKLWFFLLLRSYARLGLRKVKHINDRTRKH